MYKLIAFILLLANGPILAAEQTVGSTQLTLTVPAGQCEISDQTKFGKSFNTFMSNVATASGEKLLLMHTDCTDLETIEAKGGRLPNYVQYVVLNAFEQGLYSSQFISNGCASVTPLKSEDIAAIQKKFESDYQSVVSGIKVSQPAFLGVLFEEKDACYLGMLARVTTTDGKVDALAVGIFANVLVKGKYIQYRNYAPFRNKDSVTEALNQQKSNVALFKSKNVPSL